jgi:hypothetical protein
MVQQYLKLVAMNVAAAGKPQGDFLTEMAERVKAEIRKSVPANYRLAVRMALRKQFAKVQAAIAAV